MWLITPIGFFSIVEKTSDQELGTLTIRARLRSDLEALRNYYLPSLDPIKESKNTDYRFRAIALRKEVSAAMSQMVYTLDYDNFKNQVAITQGDKRAHLYHDVWDVLNKLQTDPAFADAEPTADSYGGVVVSGAGKVLLREPTDHYGGYVWTFAKTQPKSEETPRDTALRAVHEKMGYQGRILASIPRLFGGVASQSNFYLMEAKHPSDRPNWQTIQTKWVRFEEARELIRQNQTEKGKERDLAILDAAEKALNKIPLD